MIFDKKTGMFTSIESTCMSVANPVIEDFSKPILEGLIADLKIKEVRAIYPLIRGINSGRTTNNCTLYPAESLAGKNHKIDPTGYSSFVLPYGKPIITEHRLGEDPPMGRIVGASFVRRKKEEGEPTPPRKGHPGTYEGDGRMMILPAITDPASIVKVLGRTLQTVSIGSKVENVWESISGKNIAEAARKGEELPPYIRGQFYNGQLSYWRMGEIRGREVSFVSSPSDELAGVVDPDIGLEGIKLLVAEKKFGKANEYELFDAKTSEKFDWNYEESALDASHFIDSAKVGNNIWWLDGKEMKQEDDSLVQNESIIDEVKVEEGSMVTWGAPVTGKVVSLHTEAIPDLSIKLIGTVDEPIAKIEVYKDNKPTGTFVGHKLNCLKLVK